jgi:hypothetical protein
VSNRRVVAAPSARSHSTINASWILWLTGQLLLVGARRLCFNRGVPCSGRILGGASGPSAQADD